MQQGLICEYNKSQCNCSYLRQGGYGIASVCLFILSVREQFSSNFLLKKLVGLWITVKFRDCSYSKWANGCHLFWISDGCSTERI